MDEKIEKLKKLKQILDITDDPTGKLLELTERVETDEIENSNEHLDIRSEIELVKNETEQSISDIELLEPEKGEKGDRGEKGDKGDRGDKGEKGDPGIDGKDGVDGNDGLDGKDGVEGKIGPQGMPGEKGDKPDHQWKGSKLRFERPDGSWGKYVDLQGKDGTAWSIVGKSAGSVTVQSDGIEVSQGVKYLNFADGLTATAITGDTVKVDFNGGEVPLSNYLYKPGVAGGQTAYGGTVAGDNLTLGSTAHATKGKIYFGSDTVYDETNKTLALGTTSVDAGYQFKIVGLTPGFLVQGTTTSGSFGMGFTTSYGFAVEGAKLYYNGNTGDTYIDSYYVNGDIRLRTNVVGTAVNALTILNTGNIGMGIDPLAKLHLYQTGTTSDDTLLLLQSSVYGGTSQGKFRSIAFKDGANIVANIGSVYDGTSVNVHFNSMYNSGYKTTASTVLAIMGTGRVGIGLTTPGKELDIAGHISCTSISEPVNAATAALAGTGAGNVDNGTHRYRFAFVAPTGETALSTANVEVVVVDKTTNGKVSLASIPQSSDGRVTNIRIYRTKSASTSLYYLLATITHGTTTYTDNLTDASMGATVWNFKENTTAFRFFLNGSTGCGRFGIQNTGFGYVALNSITSGRANLGVGNSALRFCTEGDFNTGIGAGALGNLTTASACVAIGYNALNLATTVDAGFAIGVYAQSVATSYGASTAIGNYSLYTATNTTGTTSIGYQAGYAPNGVTANACTTSQYCTFIGYRTGLGSTTQRVGAIAIGYNAVVDANNTCAIGGTGADAVNVALGKTTALAKLDVYSSDANGASALGMKLNTSTFWSNIGAKLFSFSNGGNELLYQQASNGNLFILPISSGGFYVHSYQGTSDATCGIRGVGSAQLDIASNALAGAGTDKDPMIRLYVNEIASPKFVIGVDNSDSDKFKISYGTYTLGTNDRLTLTTGGLLGIGTTAPDKQLEINSSTGACLRLTYNDADGSAANCSDFSVSSGGDLTIIASGGDISFDNENLSTSGTMKAGGYKSSDGSDGATGTFTTADSKTVTVKNGLITSIT